MTKPHGSRAKPLAFVLGAFLLVCVWILSPIAQPSLNWPDRRPVGMLFLASHAHVSETNPRGWFFEPRLDFRGPAGAGRFRKALLDYAARSLELLRRAGAQGVIVWDLEGEQYPHKISYIGDPRMLARLAPEQVAVADDFFRMFRNAGFRVGLTVRPQRLTFDPSGTPWQADSGDYEQVLLEKIDYARKRWGATLFYIDSNGGPLWPDEARRLQRLRRQRPDVLLIPEHHDIRYYGFSSPYGSIRAGAEPTPKAVRLLFRNAFRSLAISDADASSIASAQANGDILLFRAWFRSSEIQILERLSGH